MVSGVRCVHTINLYFVKFQCIQFGSVVPNEEIRAVMN